MADSLPGTDTSVLPNGCLIALLNNDDSAILSISPGAGTALNGAPLGYLILGPKQQAILSSDGTNYYVVGAPDRVRLGADTTIYIATTGSNANTGLTAALPFASLQYGVDFAVRHVDLNNFTLSLQLADGTYAEGVVVDKPFVGGDSITLTGNASIPTNVVLSTSSVSNIIHVKNTGVNLVIKDLTLQTTTMGGGMFAERDGQIFFSNINFGNCAWNHITIFTGGTVVASGDYSISGGAMGHISCNHGGMFVARSSSPITITVSGTPNFSTMFCNASFLGLITVTGVTFSGSATGKRYNSDANSVITVNGGGANFFPGNVAGSTATGGLYL